MRGKCDDVSILSGLWRRFEWICFCVHCNDAHIKKDDSTKTTFGVHKLSVNRIPRGGDTVMKDELNPNANDSALRADLEKTAGSTEQDNLALQPLIDAETVSLALRLTCETNRRLHRGTASIHDDNEQAKINVDTASQQRPDSQGTPFNQQQLVQHHSVNVRMPEPANVGRYPIEATAKTIKVISLPERIKEIEKEEFTIFHAPEPTLNDVDIKQKGVLRWGPDLKVYIETLLSAIGLENIQDAEGDVILTTASTIKRKQPTSPLEDEKQLILSLTIMYLDRIRSFDNLRFDPVTGQMWHHPVPFVLPRTVHRLFLTAMIIATKSIYGENKDTSKLLKAANSLLHNYRSPLSEMDLQEMEQWMINDLYGGPMHNHQHQYHYETSYRIPPEEIGQFVRKWGEIFYPKRVEAYDKNNRSRMQKLDRFWRENLVFVGYGADHGHGNHGVGWDGHQQQMVYGDQSNYYDVQQHGGSQCN